MAKKWDAKRQQENDLFVQRVHQVFDPLSFISKETTKLPEEKKDRVQKIQTDYRDRLLEKHTNNNVYGAPDYLQRFKARDEGLPKKLAK